MSSDESNAESGRVHAAVSPPVQETTRAPIPYEQEKAMRLYMKLNPTGTELRLPEGGEVGIIQAAIEEVVRDIKGDCAPMHEADVAEINKLREALQKIYDETVDGRWSLVKSQKVAQIAALALPQEDAG